MLNKIIPYLTFIIAGSSQTLVAQIYQVDARPEKTATLAILGDATVTARKMQMDVELLWEAGGYGVSQNALTSQTMLSVLYSIYGRAALASAASYVSNSLIANYMAGGPSPWTLVATIAQVIYYQQVVENHTQMRTYAFVTPVEGDYTLQVWVPGDWDKPCSMIKVFSTIPSGTSAATTQVFNYDQTNVSDRVETIRLHLPSGVTSVEVSVGSGTLLTHSAGHMNGAMLDNATPLTWTVPGIPLTTRQINLLDSLPTVGSTNSASIVYSPNLYPSNLLDGVVSYSNLKPALFIQPLPPVNTGNTIDIYGQPTDEQLAQMGTWITTNLDAAESGTPVFDGYTATLSFTRQADFISTYRCKGRYHLTVE